MSKNNLSNVVKFNLGVCFSWLNRKNNIFSFFVTFFRLLLEE